MARVELDIDRGDERLASLIDDIKRQRDGRLPNLYKALLHSPEVAEGWLRLFTAIRQCCRLEPESRELAIMAVAVLNRADYVYRAHRQLALSSGLTQSQLDGLQDWRRCSLFDQKQRAVLAYTEAMTLRIQVPEEVFREVGSRLDEQEIVELTATIGAYNLVSRFLEALEVDCDFRGR